MNETISRAVKDFFSAFPIRHYNKGQILVAAGDDPECVFYLVEGRVKQYDISYRGDEVVLNTFKPGAFFPMSYAMNRTPNVYFFEADSACDILLAPVEDTLAFLRDNPAILYDLLERVYRGTDGLLGRLAHLMAGTARSRLLYELLIESRRFGTSRADGVALTLTESDLASRAGLARETVSREIHHLKAEGLISTDANELVIPDPERLAGAVSREL